MMSHRTSWNSENISLSSAWDCIGVDSSLNIKEWVKERWNSSSKSTLETSVMWFVWSYQRRDKINDSFNEARRDCCVLSGKNNLTRIPVVFSRFYNSLLVRRLILYTTADIFASVSGIRLQSKKEMKNPLVIYLGRVIDTAVYHLRPSFMHKTITSDNNMSITSLNNSYHNFKKSKDLGGNFLNLN